MLQLYIIITNAASNTFWAALISATFSMISISWGMASYARALRKASPETSGQMTRKAVFFYFLWVRTKKRCTMIFFIFKRFFEFTSRILTLVLFAYAYKLLVLIPICTHWIFMIGWQIYLGANFHDTQSSCVEGILVIL